METAIYKSVCRHVHTDYTATTILSKFQNEGSGQSVERVLGKLTKEKATDILAVRPISYKVIMNTF